MWKALKEGDFEQFKREINADRRKATARGPVGELPVHVAFLYNSAKHMEIAKWLMAEFPETVSEVYVGDLYDGENLLHMSIVNKQNDMIKYLIEKDPGLIHGQATGSFFARPVEVEVGADAGNFYFGEYPLSLAACTNQKTVVQYLVEHGADLAAVDKNGNNVLHICVLHERMEMFSFVLGLWRSQQHPSTTLPLDKQRNCDNHTPITLCAEENKPKMLEFLINASKNHQWSYGSVSSDLYPLDEIDPLPSPEFTGAFEIIVNRANLDCLSVDFMMKLFNAKWAKYEGLFFKRFLSMLCLVLVFTLAVILNSDKATCRDIARAPLAVSTDAPPPPKGEELAALLAQCLDEHWISLFVRQVCEITVVIGVCYSAYLEQRKIRMSGFGSGVAFAQKLMGFGFIFCILSASVLRTMESAYEDVSIAIGSLVAWGYLLFFLLGFRLTGPFIVMLYRMFVLDVSRFSILIMVCFLGFAQAFYVLFDDHGFGLFFFRIKSMFLAMLGELDFEEYSQSEFPVLTVCLIVVFVIVVTIVLLNILVAMMSTTYSEVVEEAFHQWVLEASRIMLSLQKEMTPNEMKELLKKNPNFTESNGQRYLQIISKNADQYPLETPEQMETNRRELGF